MSSLNVLNLLPNDIEFKCNKSKYTIQAGQQFQTASVFLYFFKKTIQYIDLGKFGSRTRIFIVNRTFSIS